MTDHAVIDAATALAMDHLGTLLLGGLAVTVLLLVWVVRRVVRSERPDKRLALASLLIGFAWSAEAMWEVATQKLGLAPAFAAFAFIVFESQLAVAMIRAERSQRLHRHPGRHGQAAWLIAAVMGGVAAAAGDSLVEVLLRLAVPLLVTHQWWVGMTGDGVTRPSDAISWTWTPRRVLVHLGLARPGATDLAAVDRQRHITAMVKVRHQLLLATTPRRIRRLTVRLHKLAMNADPDMLDQVRDRITLIQNAAERTRPLTPDEQTPAPAAPRVPAERATTTAPTDGRRRRTHRNAPAASERGQWAAQPDRRTSQTVGEESIALPATAQACGEWLALWSRICRETPAVAMGRPVSEESARQTFGVSVRHLRKVRGAARSGALRKHADRLAVPLPHDYNEEPQRANGHAVVAG